MRIFLLLTQRVPDLPSPLLLEVSDRLRARGHVVEGGIVEDLLLDVDGLTPQHDLYLLKSHTELALSTAAALHAQGAMVLNPYAACAAAQDKLLATRRLSAAEIPVPRTFVTGDRSRVAMLLDDGPLVVKPLRGHRGQGVHVLRDQGGLAELAWPTAPQVVQRHIEGSGEDLKVYVVGERVWAVRKPFTPLSFSVPGGPVPVSPEVEDIALRAGEATGLGLFGLDVIEGSDGPVVVDLNYFPGYKGCEGVAEPMADYVHAYAVGDRTLSLPAMPPAIVPVGVAAPRFPALVP